MNEPAGLCIYEEKPVSQIVVEGGVLNMGQWVKCSSSDAIGPVVGADTDRPSYGKCFLIIPCCLGYEGGGPIQEWRILPSSIDTPSWEDFQLNVEKRRRHVIDNFHIGDRCLHTPTEDIVTVLDPDLHAHPKVSTIKTIIQVRTSDGDIQSTSTGGLINITSTGFGSARLLYGVSNEPVTATGQLLFWGD